MMRLNNRGFAISTLLYGLLIVIVLIMFLLINTMSFNRKNNKEFTDGIIKELEEMEVNTPKTLIDTVELGDYIKLVPSNSSYTIPASKTGYSQDQTINPSELTIWRVISKDSNGIEVVSNSASSNNIYFSQFLGIYSDITETTGNVIGYRNFIQVLNEIAAQYDDGVHVKETRHMGYDSSMNIHQRIEDISSITSKTAPWSCSTDGNCGIEERLGGGDNSYIKDCELVKTALGTLSAASYYWLASRYYEYKNSDTWLFYGRTVNRSGEVYYYNCTLEHYSGGFILNSNSNAIRPILTLFSDSKIGSGEGTNISPYTLV